MKTKLLTICFLLISIFAGAQQKLIVYQDCEKNGATIEYSNAPAGVEMVDLGLSVKWANMNVGATTPEEYGMYFAWGETQGYTGDTSDGRSFNWDDYKWMTAGQTYWSGVGINKYTIADGQTSGCWYNDGIFVGDNKTVLESADDAATANWGGAWRMPTDAEWTELLRNCTWTWMQVNGVDGYRVSASNGNSIFLPAAGYRRETSLESADTFLGNYWSASLYSDDSSCAYGVSFKLDFEGRSVCGRQDGRSVRPVRL